MRLNKGQEEAIRHGDGPCMVLAPPGSGKTLIVTRRTRYLIEEMKVPPEDILVITFTRYAAREMRERFGSLTKGKNYKVTFGTFHSVFYGILKCAYGINGRNLLSEQEQLKLLRDVLNKMELQSEPEVQDEEELLRELMREIGVVKNGLLHLRDFHSDFLNDEEFPELFRAYEQQKKQRKKFDFDDMLVQCYALFRKREDILRNWQKKFRYILIDEFQDINRVQYEVIRMLAAPEYNLFVVGDDDQSIYGFRGARPELMLYMKQEFPNIRTIPLTVNYRSTDSVVAAASRVILHNDSRFYKRVQAYKPKGENVRVQEVLDEAEESRFVAESIANMAEETPLGQVAVLYRTVAQARMLSEALIERQIPFEMREHIPNFYEHFIAKDMLAYMKLAQGFRDRPLFLRAANRPVRYISRESLSKTQITFEELRIFYEDKEWMLDAIDQFEVDLKMLENMAPYAAVQYIRKRIGYDTFLREYGKENGITWEQLMQIMSELEERCKPYRTVTEWEEHIKVYTEELERQKQQNSGKTAFHEDRVQLMTMHSAKGLEFDTVFIIHANEGQVPYLKARTTEELEEERRMFYVAMTRAKEHLIISYVTERNGNGMKPSRFVEELLGKPR